mmetsp:Transcript_22517/g.53152  ORF Transcript_22517/g.53152 Transcript_22517/m.53152 type:complete len:229 (-) Transcript_22517:548-1234(-)
MSFASTAGKTLHRRTALLRANIGVLGQKLDLIHALRKTLGANQANVGFAEMCPVVGASIGQHFRHSMDHMERVANIIEAEKEEANDEDGFSPEIHYDLRVRGGSDEHDMDEAEGRIRRVIQPFQEGIEEMLSSSMADDDGCIDDAEDNDNTTVLACFMLSGDPAADEFLLSSTVERELGFVAHHAIHHLAMVKIITMHTLKLLPPDALPEGFGKAPSTIVYDNSQDQQ